MLHYSLRARYYLSNFTSIEKFVEQFSYKEIEDVSLFLLRFLLIL